MKHKNQLKTEALLFIRQYYKESFNRSHLIEIRVERRITVVVYLSAANDFGGWYKVFSLCFALIPHHLSYHRISFGTEILQSYLPSHLVVPMYKAVHLSQSWV